MKRTVVIGGAGFIGRHVTRLLCEGGGEVVVLGRRTKADRDLHPACHYVSGDYGNRAILREVLSGGCDVLDLAYATVPKTSFEDPVFDLASNVPASVGLFQEALAAGVRRVLVVSSGGTVYGPSGNDPISEDHATMPVSPYGITKLTIDRYAMMFRHTAGLPVIVVRPANAYGEEQRAGTGQGFIATAIASVLAGKTIDLFGPAGTVRDYIHVTDVASGIVAALAHGTPGGIYNIGTGVGSSNADIVGLLGRLATACGFDVRTQVLPAREFDVACNILDSTRLRQETGWAPAISLEEGLSMVWEARRGGGRTS